MNEKNPTDSLLYKIMQYLYYFLSVNLYFLLSNSLFIASVLFFQISLSNLFVYAVALIPTGASLTALFYTMGKLHRDKNIQPASDYWKAYKKNFFASTKYWLVILFLLIVLLVDILFVLNRRWLVLTVISFVVLGLVILSSIYGFSLLARFEVSIKNLLIFSVLLIYQNKLNSLSNLSLFVAFGLILYGFLTYALLVIFAVAGYYFMRNNHTIMEKLKDTYLNVEEG